jgi:hypothetical protein
VVTVAPTPSAELRPREIGNAAGFAARKLGDTLYDKQVWSILNSEYLAGM